MSRPFFTRGTVQLVDLEMQLDKLKDSLDNAQHLKEDWLKMAIRREEEGDTIRTATAFERALHWEKRANMLANGVKDTQEKFNAEADRLIAQQTEQFEKEN